MAIYQKAIKSITIIKKDNTADTYQDLNEIKHNTKYLSFFATNKNEKPFYKNYRIESEDIKRLMFDY